MFHLSSWLTRLQARSRTPRPAPRPTSRCSLERLEERVVLTARYVVGSLRPPAFNRTDVGLGNPGGFNPIEPRVSVSTTDPANVIVTSHIGLQSTANATGSFSIRDNFPLPTDATRSNGDTDTAFDADGRLFWTNLARFEDPVTGNFIRRTIAVAEINPDPTSLIQIGATSTVPNPNDRADDKPFLAADANPASPFANNLYLAWSRFGDTPGEFEVNFSRSTDRGVTWSDPIQLSDFNGPDDVANNEDDEGFCWPADVSVAPNGDIYVAYHSQPDLNNDEVGTDGMRMNSTGDMGQIIVFRSTDGGLTFPQRTVAFTPGTADVSFNARDAANGNTIPGARFWTLGTGQPWVLVDPVRPGNVYVVTSDDPDNNHNDGTSPTDVTGDSSDVVISRSTDNGLTWTRSTISAGPNNSFQLTPTAAIDEFGNIVVAWYDNRRRLTNTGADGVAGNADDSFLLDVFATYSRDGGRTFTREFQVNDRNNPHDPDVGADIRFEAGDLSTTRGIGEYFGLDLFGGTAYVAWAGNTRTNGTPTGQQVTFDAFALNGALVVEGDEGGVRNDVFLLRAIADNPGFFELLVNNQRQYAGLLDGVQLGITINGFDGRDRLIVDLENGNPIPTSGITFNGGLGPDTVVVEGSALGDTLVIGPGSVTANGRAVRFNNTEAVRVFGDGGADRLTLRFDQGQVVPVNGLIVEGGLARDTLVTVGSRSGDTFRLTATQLIVNNAAVDYLTIEQMDIFAGEGNDRFEGLLLIDNPLLDRVAFNGENGNDVMFVLPGLVTEYFMNGGPPSRGANPGDALFLIRGSQVLQRPIVVTNGGADGMYRFTNRKPVNFVSIERGIGSTIAFEPWMTLFTTVA